MIEWVVPLVSFPSNTLWSPFLCRCDKDLPGSLRACLFRILCDLSLRKGFRPRTLFVSPWHDSAWLSFVWARLLIGSLLFWFHLLGLVPPEGRLHSSPCLEEPQFIWNVLRSPREWRPPFHKLVIKGSPRLMNVLLSGIPRVHYVTPRPIFSWFRLIFAWGPWVLLCL